MTYSSNSNYYYDPARWCTSCHQWTTGMHLCYCTTNTVGIAETQVQLPLFQVSGHCSHCFCIPEADHIRCCNCWTQKKKSHKSKKIRLYILEEDNKYYISITLKKLSISMNCECSGLEKALNLFRSKKNSVLISVADENLYHRIREACPWAAVKCDSL